MRSTRLIAVAALLVAGACSSDSPSSPVVVTDPQLSADVARISGETAAQDVEAMRGPGMGPFAFGLGWTQRGFDCSRELRPRLTVTRTCVFKDAAGTVQATFSPAATASVNVKLTIKGDITREHWTGTVDRSSDLTVSGLAGEETRATWNGSFSSHKTRARITDDGTTRTYDFTASGTVSNVVIPVPRAWPLSGTITKTVKVIKPDGTVVTRQVSITFNGTNIARITVNGESFDFDLAMRHGPQRRGN